jgi:hypothetical protein
MLPLPDRLLQNAIDIHCHCFPEFSLDARNRLEDMETVKAAASVGMQGIVFKSHLWPTMANVYNLQKYAPSDFRVWGGIVLNPSSGGISVWGVEAAVKQGAAIVWMPTWGAKNDIQRGGFSRFVFSQIPSLVRHLPEGISILDSSGELKSETNEVLELAKEMNFAIGTGHLSIEESLALAKKAKELGINKLFCNHPDNRTIGASINEIKQLSEMGVYIELCFLNTLPMVQQKHPREKVEIIKEIGPEKCIISTDTFYSWVPPEPEIMRMNIACFLELGLKEDEIKIMVQYNPSKLLGIL